MELAFYILSGVYLTGVVGAIILLHFETKELLKIPKSTLWILWKVLKNLPLFYLSSWYGVSLIILKRETYKIRKNGRLH